MGAGAGIASGLGKLGQFGFNQPVLAVCGDSTFFHATIPALINGIYNQSNFILIILDNNATAMTGFQPHPGTGMTAMGEPTKVVSMDTSMKLMVVWLHHCSESRGPGELHIILVDNGRTQMRESAEFREALYCIKYGARLNVCKVIYAKIPKLGLLDPIPQMQGGTEGMEQAQYWWLGLDFPFL
jgi:hypothetical protein